MSLIEVVGALFGGSKDDKSSPEHKGIRKINDMSAEDAVASLNNLFSRAGP